MFCEEVLHNRSLHTHKLKSVTYFGSGDSVDKDLIERFELSEESSLKFEKIVKNSCLYESLSRKKQRSNNSFAQLTNGEFVQIVEFVLDSETEQELTVCKKLKTKNVSQVHWTTVQQVIEIVAEKSVINTESITTICVYISVDEISYICPLANLLHY